MMLRIEDFPLPDLPISRTFRFREVCMATALEDMFMKVEVLVRILVD